MARATWVLAATTLAFAATSIWLYRENLTLRDHITTAPPTAAMQAAPLLAKADTPDPWLQPARAPARATAAPALPAPHEESRMERRQRHLQEFAAMFGRADGETEDEYRARIVPLIKKLDHAFDKTYADVLDYTNKAIADGQLSPYERNVAGWLEVAGGFGAILQDAQSQIGQVHH